MSVEKRKDADRRKTFRTPLFPLEDCEGRIVLRDRRVQPERRVQAIEVEWKFDRRELLLKRAG